MRFTVLFTTVLCVGCSDGHESLVHACVDAHMRAHREMSEGLKGTDWIDRWHDARLRGQDPDETKAAAEARAYRTCLKAAAARQ